MTRRQLRENTFKLLYCDEFHDESEMGEQYNLYFAELDGLNEEDRDFITNRVTAIAQIKTEIDDEINKVAVGWTTNRMSLVDLCIIRLAYFEMKKDDNIPEKVAIDQAVELAKKYGSDDSPSFVNGILAKMF